MLRQLPADVQEQVVEAYRRFLIDPTARGLRLKQIGANPPTYSARVGISFRAVGAKGKNGIVWYWVGSHADYDQMLRQL